METALPLTIGRPCVVGRASFRRLASPWNGAFFVFRLAGRLRLG
jgi:hypothetical protein